MLQEYSISNKKGLSLTTLNLGGIITELLVPNKDGDMVNVVLSYKNKGDYQNDEFNLGGIVGRYANRINEGKFSLNGSEYQLETNGLNYHLHGGKVGLNKVLWDIELVDSNRVILKHISPHQTEGYPGNLNVMVSYQLTENNELRISYQASTDRSTIINLTNHAYFNLSGSDQSILNHIMKIHSDQILDVNEEFIPSGKFNSVISSPFDFTKAQSIRTHISPLNDLLKPSFGYDHSYVFNEGVMEEMATINCSASGVSMDVMSSEPSLHLYTGNYLSGQHSQYAGVCFETQHFADSPNHLNFPSTILEKGEVFESTTIFKFNL